MNDVDSCQVLKFERNNKEKQYQLFGDNNNNSNNSNNIDKDKIGSKDDDITMIDLNDKSCNTDSKYKFIGVDSANVFQEIQTNTQITICKI